MKILKKKNSYGVRLTPGLTLYDFFKDAICFRTSTPQSVYILLIMACAQTRGPQAMVT